MRDKLLALQRRRTWCAAVAVGCVVAAGLMGWILWHFWVTAWSLPLNAPLTEIHFPPQVFNDSGLLIPAPNRPAMALQLLAILCGLLTVLLQRGFQGRHRFIVIVTGSGCAALMLLAAWAMLSDSKVNGAVRRLAESGEFAELERVTRRRPNLPYATYIGAQALVLAGKGAQLRAEYGPWLEDWGREAAKIGYMRPGMKYGDLPFWRGMSASEKVMRQLEVVAFGRGVSVFATEYENRVRRDTATAWRYGGWVGAAFVLFALGAGLLAARAVQLTRQISDLRAWLLQEEVLAVEVARNRPPLELPPIEMDPGAAAP